MVPVSTSAAAKSCADPISSNCVMWDGPAIPGLCGRITLTQAVQSISTACCGTANTSPCYTGNWIDFSSTIPLSGVSTGGGGLVPVSWNIINFGCSLGFSTTISAENKPQYKWTKAGDLSLRGSFNFQFNPFVGIGVFTIPLVTIPLNCFPANFNAAQSHLVSIDLVGPQQFQLFTKGYIRIETTGVLNLFISIESLNGFFGSYVISFGGVTFNLS